MDKDTVKEISLAVFPFENFSEGNGTDVFCKAFQIDFTTELSRFRQFRIVSPKTPQSSIMPATDYTITGSFHFFENRLKINAQLVNNDNHHIAWAERFEGSRESLFSIQEGLLTKVVAALQQQLNYDLLAHFRRKSKVDITAYEHWLFGMEELKKGTLESDEAARVQFQRAIDIDPSFSLAYSGMSMTYFNEWSCQLWERWEVSQAGAYEWARKAIEIDEQNYIAACVLGRIYLYEGEYDIAEHYLRRALKLNPNDTEILIQIASCFVFLGHVQEAGQLYQRILQLNPHHTYHQVAAMIAFETGDYAKCIALGTSATTTWVDFPAFMAAAYFHLGDLENMRRYWDSFLRGFEKRILHGKKADEVQAVQWIMNVNPYRERTNFKSFWAYISGERVAPDQPVPSRISLPTAQNYFMKQDDRWEICFAGQVVHITGVKGFNDLETLLMNPGKQFHCTELAGGGIVSSHETVFDQKARTEYQNRIRELQEEITLSEGENDLARSAALQKEYDTLIDHLSQSLGIGGRIRKANDPLEKTRSAVTWRIRTAIQKIAKFNEKLGRHLSLAIKTGMFCSYNPEQPVTWAPVDHPRQ